jgi:hypothetical protein
VPGRGCQFPANVFPPRQGRRNVAFIACIRLLCLRLQGSRRLLARYDILRQVMSGFVHQRLKVRQRLDFLDPFRDDA